MVKLMEKQKFQYHYKILIVLVNLSQSGLDEISISGDNTLRISTIISALEVSNATGKMTEVKY